MAHHHPDDFSFLPTVDSADEEDVIKEEQWPVQPPPAHEDPALEQQEAAEEACDEELHAEVPFHEEVFYEDPPPAVVPSFEVQLPAPAKKTRGFAPEVTDHGYLGADMAEQPAKTPAKVSLRPMAASQAAPEERTAPVIPRRAEPSQTPAIAFGRPVAGQKFTPVPLVPLAVNLPPEEEPLPPQEESAPQPESAEPAIHAGLAVDAEIAPADISQVIKQTLKYAFFITIGLHVAASLILVLKHVPMTYFASPEIVATTEGEHQEDESWKKVTAAVPQTSAMAASISPLLSTGISDMAMPEVDFSATSSDLNLGTSFGSFGTGVTTGGAGGKVSFLGNTATAKHVVFVVDVSGSMSASMNVSGGLMTRFDLLKRELNKSIGSLATGTAYQVLFFSDFAWPHDVVDSNDMRALNAYDWKITAADKGAKVPRFSYLAANSSNIARSKKIILAANNPGGTNWGSGLIMALKGSPKPDVIFFMTDGNRSDEQGWIEAVTAENNHGKRTIIHTTALGTPDAARDLDLLAKRNGGKFTAVMADGKIMQGKDFLP